MHRIIGMSDGKYDHSWVHRGQSKGASENALRETDRQHGITK